MGVTSINGVCGYQGLSPNVGVTGVQGATDTSTVSGDFYFTDDAESNQYFTDNSYTNKFVSTGGQIAANSGKANALFVGQSVYRQAIAVGADADFVTEALAQGFASAQVVNGAKDSTAVRFEADSGSGAWLNSTNDGRGDVYINTMLPAVVSAGLTNYQITHIFVLIGNTDRAALQAGTITEAQHKAGFSTLLGFLRTDFPYAIIVVTPNLGDKTLVTSAADTAWDAIKRAQWQVMNESSGVYKESFGTFDLTRDVGGQHLDSTGATKIMQRNARLAASLSGIGSPNNPYGPQISSATFDAFDESVQVTISYDSRGNATNYTMTDPEHFIVYVNGSGTALIPDAVVKNSSTQFTLSGGTLAFSEGDAATLGWPGGTSHDMTETDILIDNATNPLPLRPIFALSMTETDTAPAGFSFADVTGANTSTQYTADATVTSFQGTLTASVTAGTAEIRKNSTGGWGSSVNVSSGDTINARMTSSASASTQVSSTITLGHGSDTWSITTIGSYQEMGAVESSTVFDLDATVSASYGGSGQTWSNLESSPADSSLQTAYDLYLGTTSGSDATDPTFTGSAGSASAYFSCDGGDYLTLKSGSNTTFINDFHKFDGTNPANPKWFACAFRYVDSGAAQRLLCTNASQSATGIQLYVSSGDKLSVTQNNGGSFQTWASTASLVDGTDYVVIISWQFDAAGTNNVRLWINSHTKESKSNIARTNTSNPAGSVAFGAETDAGSPLANGTRLRAFSAGNAFIDDAAATAIMDQYEARHGINYA